MKKFFVTLAIAMMFMITGCTCGRQTEQVVEEPVIESVEAADSVAVEVLEATDSTLVVEE